MNDQIKTFILCTLAFLVGLLMIGCNTNRSTNDDIDKILKAKAVVRTMVNYPDTLDFHDMKTRVIGNKVYLTFTASNAFGVEETHTVDIDVN